MRTRKASATSVIILLALLSQVSCSATMFQVVDNDARDAQVLLDSSVKVEVSYSIDVTPIADLLESPPSNGLLKRQGSGSGTVMETMVRNGKLESLILTAAHVCEVPKVIDLTPIGLPVLNVVDSSFATVNIKGVRLVADIVYENPINDLCVLRVKGVPGPKMQLADSLPPLGARIVHAGAPWGVFGNGTGVIMDGRYAGIKDINDYHYAIAGMPSTPGSSGGGVYYRGKLFAVLVAVERRLAHVTLCIELDHIKAVMIEAKSIWQKMST